MLADGAMIPYVASRVSSPRLVKDASLPLDEDQYDIPTFLRRHGSNELP